MSRRKPTLAETIFAPYLAEEPATTPAPVDYPDGTGATVRRQLAGTARRHLEAAIAEDKVTWQHMLTLDVAELFATPPQNPAELQAALSLVQATTTAWSAAIDRRTETPA